jgi:predicted nucleic acid-binding Zn ribbon protein
VAKQMGGAAVLICILRKKKRRKKRGRMELMSVLTLLNLLTKFSREYCDEKYH